MMNRLRALCAALALAFGLAGLSYAPKANAQAQALPPGEVCFQATTGLNGLIGTLGNITGGAGGTDGLYVAIALTGGSGTTSTANITVSGGTVSQVVLLNPGVNYVVGDTLSATSGTIGGVTGFSVPVASISINSSLAGGTVGMYIPSTLTIKQTWKNANQTTMNTNPIQLDSNGCALIYGVGTYRQILFDSLGNVVWDQLTSVAPINPFFAGNAGGTANAITVTDASFSGTDGQSIQFIATATNTGAVTLTPSGTGTPEPIVKNTTPGGPVALTGGEIATGNLVWVTYSAANSRFYFDPPQKPSVVISVTDFLPAGQPDGTTDNTAQIQNGANAICLHGGTLYFPTEAHPYVISAATGITMCGGGWVLGDGAGQLVTSYVNITGAGSAAIFNWPGNPVDPSFGTSATSQGGIRNMGFYFPGNSNTSATQQGPAVQFKHCQHCIADNISTFQSFVSYIAYASFNPELSNFAFNQVVAGGYGIALTGDDMGGACDGNLGACPNRSDVPSVHHGVVSAAATNTATNAQGILVRDFVAGYWIDHVILNQVTNGVAIDCPTSGVLGACPQFGSIIRMESEPNGSFASSAHGIYANDVVDLEIDDPEIFGSNGNGVLNDIFVGQSRFISYDVHIHHGRLNGAVNSCIIAAVTQNLIIDHMQLVTCGGAFQGIQIDAPSAGSYSVINLDNNQLCNEAGTTFASHGILFNAGGDYLLASQNNFKGCTDGVTDSSGGAHNIVSPNIGP